MSGGKVSMKARRNGGRGNGWRAAAGVRRQPQEVTLVRRVFLVLAAAAVAAVFTVGPSAAQEYLDVGRYNLTIEHVAAGSLTAYNTTFVRGGGVVSGVQFAIINFFLVGSCLSCCGTFWYALLKQQGVIADSARIEAGVVRTTATKVTVTRPEVTDSASASYDSDSDAMFKDAAPLGDASAPVPVGRAVLTQTVSTSNDTTNSTDATSYETNTGSGSGSGRSGETTEQEEVSRLSRATSAGTKTSAGTPPYTPPASGSKSYDDSAATSSSDVYEPSS